MKIPLILVFLMSTRLLFGITVPVRIVDDQALPVSNADVSVWFWSVKNSFEDEKKYLSDHEGRVVATGQTLVGYSVNARKAGHYDAKSEPYISPDKVDERTYVLPRILNPIPLYASSLAGGRGSLKFPVQDEWLGYDFEAGDWVAPHGSGENTDIRFKFHSDFSGWRISDEKVDSVRKANADKSEDEIRFYYGIWEGSLEISFPGEKEGLIEVTDRYWPHSELKLPHEAPESGYFPTRRYDAHTRGPRKEDPDVGYYLRTRVKLDAEGEIISAHYAKIYGDFRFDPRGAVSFTYYFNPTPNDRNLEFDPKRNLFPKDRDGINNLSP